MTDPVWAMWITSYLPWAYLRVLGWDVNWAQIAGATFVVVAGKQLARRAEARAVIAHKAAGLAVGNEDNRAGK